MFGAVAAGRAAGGYDSIFDAAKSMARLKAEGYRPIKDNQVVYEQLYSDYARLHDYFGRGGNDVMKRLKALRARIQEG
jgi:L-ribulokinase